MADSKKTHQIETELKDSKDLQKFLDENNDEIKDIDFKWYLNKLIFDKNSSAAKIIKKTNIDKSYFYQFLNGRRKPGRDKLILISIALCLNLEETQKLLKIGMEGALYAKNKRDVIIQYCIINKYSVDDTQGYLDDNGFEILQ
ncbi:MAG: helix-turn-helix transcriptional regulator [Clostridia bacterium]|nr:helix-turn-helix transcriptional regulator [Clostridia bacterium]